MQTGLNKFKDGIPIYSIARIRNILHDLGLLTVEQWHNSLEGICSLRLNIAGTGVGQNGKGVTPEYALASAYGEFMERLQSRHMYDETALDPEVLKAGGFYFAPDEKYSSIGDILSDGHQLFDLLLAESPPQQNGAGLARLAGKLGQWFGNGVPPGKREELARKWTVATPEGCPGDFVALPYYSVREDRLCYIPQQMLKIVYGSNGTCAGNTPEEALVHGMSELMERHVHLKIMKEKIAPPVVPEEYLKEYPFLCSLLKAITMGGRYKAVVKDCSLGGVFPVVALALIDNQSQCYFVKFGAHPSFEIALERCLTEMLQGKDLHLGLNGMMTQFDYCDRRADLPENRNTVLRIGAGSYPAEFFAGSARDFCEFPRPAGRTNSEMMRGLARIILNQGHDLLVRDMSYLGFPSFHLVAPGFSEVFEYGEKRLDLEKLRQESKKIMRDLPGASPEELRKVTSYLIRRGGYVLEGDSPARLLGFPVKQSFPLNAVPRYVFISALLYRWGKIKEAHGMLSKFIAYARITGQENPQAIPDLRYYRCLRDYLGIRAAGEDGAEQVLYTVYPQDTVQTVLEDWGKPDHLLDRYGPLACFSCRRCPARAHCCQEQVRALHIRVKERQAGNPLDQTRLAGLFRFARPAGTRHE